MKQLTFLSCAIFLIQSNLIAQDPQLDWAYRLGGVFLTESSASALEKDSAGNLYTLGNYTNGEVDFDHGPGIFNLTQPLNQAGLYLMKSDANGNFT